MKKNNSRMLVAAGAVFFSGIATQQVQAIDLGDLEKVARAIDGIVVTGRQVAPIIDSVGKTVNAFDRNIAIIKADNRISDKIRAIAPMFDAIRVDLVNLSTLVSTLNSNVIMLFKPGVANDISNALRQVNSVLTISASVPGIIDDIADAAAAVEGLGIIPES